MTNRLSFFPSTDFSKSSKTLSLFLGDVVLESKNNNFEASTNRSNIKNITKDLLDHFSEIGLDMSDLIN